MSGRAPPRDGRRSSPTPFGHRDPGKAGPPRTAKEMAARPLAQREQGERRAQSNLQPPTQRRGDATVADVLFDALQAGSERDALDSPYPHGFHSWPAGLHPAIAAVVLDGLLPMVPEGGVVDAFAGGGTVGLEAMLHGRPFVGTDINPLSRLVGGERCRPRSTAASQAVSTILDEVVERSKERVRQKRPSRAPIPPEIARQYAPHVLMELAGLLAEIDGVRDAGGPAAGVRSTFAVAFSSILTKVSNRRGDTHDDVIDGDASKRVGRFIPTERFADKVVLLLDKQVALHDAVGDTASSSSFVTADARTLPDILGRKKASLIFTSPPYGGTYDYTRHHAHRLAFLGLDDVRFDRDELLSRRRQDRTSFDTETRQMLLGFAAVLHPDGLAVVVVGDGQINNQRVDAADHLEGLARSAGLEVIAVAAAPRPDFTGGPLRGEHIVALRQR